MSTPEESHASPPQPDPPGDPGFARVQKYLMYTLSLPERALRSGGAVVGGAIRESAGLLVPQAFQNSKTYSVMVRQMLDFLAEDVGRVKRSETASAEPQVENFVARKAVGNFVEMAGLATLHVSPLLILAVVSDVAYGSQSYLAELAGELRKEGLIDETSKIHHADDLLEAVAKASSVTAGAFNTPPLSVDGLRQTIEETRAALKEVDPSKVLTQAELRQMWDGMHEMATRDGVSLLAVSGAMTLFTLDKLSAATRGALSGVRVAGALLDRHIVNHYASALTQIRRDGVYATLSKASGAYIEAVWRNFSAAETTFTEEAISGRLFAPAWKAAHRWLAGEDRANPPTAS